MFNVSDNYKNAILSDVRDMPYRVTLAGGVTLTQDDIPNMSLTESMGDTNSLAIGSANAAELNLTLRNPAGVDYNNMLVEPESGLVLEDGSIEWIPLGKFWVTNVSTSNDYKTVKLSCIDGMYLLSGDYVSELTYPTTLKAVVKEIVSQSGVEFVEPEVWPDIVVRVKPEGMTYRNAIGYAAGCMGCNARFNRDGKLELVWYSGSGVTIERNTQYLNGMTKLHDKPLTVYVEVTGAQEKYEVTIISDNNGRVSASPSRNVLEGDLVSLSVRPNNKYELSAISAVDANGVAVTLSADAEGAGYTFTQPDSNVTVTAAFRSTAGGPYKLTVRSSGNGTLTCQGSGLEAGDNYFNAGDEVYIAPSPNSGYEFNNFYTTPAGIEIVQDSRFWYLFTMPESDVTVTANFREAITFNVNRYWGSGEGYISATNETTNGNTFHEGDLVNVYIAPATGYAFDYYECSVEMTQIDEYNYQFIMPAETVNITVYFKFADDESKTDTLSFLQHPSRALPPTTKPYWAVFYKYDEYVGSNARYYLVWFDSWSESNGSITMNGYYYCRGSNNGYFAHTWDNSSWSGSGASGSSITWDSLLGKRGEDDYCLLASNVHLYSSYGSIAFEKCESAISQTQGSRLLNGADIRDAGVFAKYPCPDTYSTPLPAANWMVVYYPEINKESEDGSSRETLFPGTYYNYALYFDSVSVTDVGQWFDKD